ncbi:MAG: COX15/CtaA family protein [Hyphomonadaceae bacterium]
MAAPSNAAPARDPLVGAWLTAICALVVAMIVVGGLTRLTDSGLSITEWRLDKGLTPPLTAARWAEEFALYRQTAEYQLQNRGMSLTDFQAIYWWEWAHRFLGKLIGLVFAAPFLALWAMGRLKGLFWPVLGFGLLGGLQGAIGWWMVVSGLEGRLDVSSIRLAVHLGMAFAILGVGTHLAMGAFGWRKGVADGLVWAFAATLFAQILLGALTAGADAGKAFADWPTIGGELWPASYLGGPFIENAAALQFAHRTAGYLVLAFALFLALRPGAAGPARLVGVLAALQAGLGVATIVTGAHLGLSLVHQLGAVALWIAAMFMLRNGGKIVPHI